MENKIYIGKITTTHGIKGELKVISDFEKKDRVLKPGFKIIINNNEHVITKSHIHKNNYLITIDNINDINLVENFRNSEIYIFRSNLNLKPNEYLLSDLISFEVFDKEDYIGTVENIASNSANNLLVIKGDKLFYIPFIEVYIKNVDIANKKIDTLNGKELII